MRLPGVLSSVHIDRRPCIAGSRVRITQQLGRQEQTMKNTHDGGCTCSAIRYRLTSDRSEIKGRLDFIPFHQLFPAFDQGAFLFYPL